ncbi:MAG: c(7)-type cytochrome triheme domain-containing protein [Deltaproteobacteria bacterium]
MIQIGKTLRRLAVLAAVALAGTALAGGLDKLPPDFTFPPGDGSPGKVTFSHQSHVDVKKPGCTTCHPKLFKTLEKGATADGAPIRHAVMEKGGQCGTCHGKGAFGFDSCDLCHR